jgi:Ca2+-binding EF-hand superfamily protein
LTGFQAYDSKGVGFIKKERLREVFDSCGLGGPTLTEEELNMIVKNADVDGDGVVTLEDFRALVAAQQKDLQGQASNTMSSN